MNILIGFLNGDYKMKNRKICLFFTIISTLLLFSCNQNISSSSSNELSNSDTYKGSFYTYSSGKTYSWELFPIHGTSIVNFNIPIPLITWNYMYYTSDSGTFVSSLKKADITGIDIMRGFDKLDYQCSWSLDSVCTGSGTNSSVNALILNLSLTGEAKDFYSIVIHLGKNSVELKTFVYFKNIDNNKISFNANTLGSNFTFNYLSTSCWPSSSINSTGDITSDYVLDLSSSSNESQTFNFMSGDVYSRNAFLNNRVTDTSFNLKNEFATTNQLTDNSAVYNVRQILQTVCNQDNLFSPANPEYALFPSNLACFKIDDHVVYSIYKNGKEIDLTSTKDLYDYYYNILVSYQSYYNFSSPNCNPVIPHYWD